MATLVAAVTVLAGPSATAATATVATIAATAGTTAANPAANVSHATVPLTAGADELGQQGNGAADGARLTPGLIDGPAAVAITSGRETGYLLDAQGQVWAWGDNSMGQVGDGTRTQRQSAVPALLPTVVEIDAGHYHCLALDADGQVWSWGYGGLGQLGTGSLVNQPTPKRLSLTGIAHVYGGRDMSYALRTDGTVLAWGDNTYGEIGDGTTTRRPTPVPVPGLSGIVEIAAGRDHALAIDSAGGVWAWGDNTYGQLGDGTTTRRLMPVRIATSGYAHVGAGAHHSMALRTDGTVQTWGRGYRGALGLGGTANQLTPKTVPGLPPIASIGDGRDQSFAVTAASGQVFTWGYNDAGQLGDGTTTTRLSPVLLGSLSGIAVAASGSRHTVFLRRGTPPAPVTYVASAAANANLTTQRVVVPGVVRAGDGLVLVLSVNAATTIGTPAGVTGWTPVRTVTGPDYVTQVWAKQASASDAGKAVKVTLATTHKATFAVAAYRGTSSAVVTASAGAVETVSRTAHTTPGVTVATDGSMLVSVWSETSATTTTLTPPAGQSQRLLSTGTSTAHETLLLTDSSAGPGTAGGLTAVSDAAAAKDTMLSLVLGPA